MLDRVDLILVMTVNPGFGGQAFIPASRQDRARAGDDRTRPIHLEVDGGVTPDTAGAVRQGRRRVLVAGNAVFKGGRYSGEYCGHSRGGGCRALVTRCDSDRGTHIQGSILPWQIPASIWSRDCATSGPDS